MTKRQSVTVHTSWDMHYEILMQAYICMADDKDSVGSGSGSGSGEAETEQGGARCSACIAAGCQKGQHPGQKPLRLVNLQDEQHQGMLHASSLSLFYELERPALARVGILQHHVLLILSHVHQACCLDCH